MNSEPDSTFCLTTDDVQSMAEAMPTAFKRVVGEVNRTIRMRDAETADDFWGPIVDAIPEENAFLFTKEFRKSYEAGDPFPEVSAKCELEDVSVLLANEEVDPYYWLDEDLDS
jgi:hypothetical protein